MVVFFTLPYSVTIISTRTSIVFSLFFFFLWFCLIIYFWLYWVFAAAQTFSSCGEQELLSSCNARASHCSGFSWCRAQALACARLQYLQHTGSVVVAPRLSTTGSVVVAHGLSCSAVYGVFLDQVSNPCFLQWQADSSPLRHQGSPPSSKRKIVTGIESSN